MEARLLFRDKYIYIDGAIREMVIWQIPSENKQSSHGLKYRLYYGYPGISLVRYDNETGKGDHRHYRDMEEAYVFTTVEQLIEDFRTDIQKLRNKGHE